MGKVTLLCGPPGCGKSEEVLSRYVAQVQQAGCDSAVLILPTANVSRETSRRLLKKGLLSGLADARIFTFPDLAEELLRANHAQAPEITGLQQELLMRQVLREVDADQGLDALAGSAQTSGLVPALLGFIDELKRAAVGPDDFAARLQQVDLDRPLDRELCAIYHRYQQLLSDNRLYDAAGKFWEARDLLRAGKLAPLQRTKRLFVDGFADLTTTQIQVLAELASFAAETVITFPYQPDEAREEVRLLPARTLQRLQKLMPEAECEAAANAESPDDALAWLRRQLFAINPTPVDGYSQQIRLNVAESARAEVSGIAAEVKRLLLEEVPAANICVVFRQPERWRDLVSQTFDEYGVPHHFSAKDGISGQPLVQVVMSLLNIVAGDFRREDVVNFLRSDLIDLSCLQNEAGEPDSDTVYTVACQVGIVGGREQWVEALGLRARRLEHQLALIRERGVVEEADDEAELPTDAEELSAELSQVEAVQSLLSALFTELDRLPETGTMAEHIAALHRLMERFGLSAERLADRSAAALHNRDNLRAFDGFCEALRQYQEAERLGASEVIISVAEFVSELNALVRQLRFSPDRQPQGRVRVVDVHDLRQARVPYLLLADLAQSSFPLVFREDVFYTEAERRRLSEQADLDLRTRPNNETAEAFLFHEAVSAATARLYLSYTDTGSDGNPILPSQYFEEVKRLLQPESDGPEQHQTPAVERAAESFGVRQLREYAFGGMFAGSLAQADEDDVLAAYNLLCEIDGPVLRRAAGSALAERQRYSREPFDCYDGVLDDERLIAQLATDWGPEHLYSASQLSAYGSCPFKFFMQRVLGLESVAEPEEEIDRAARGTLVHRILARFLTEWTTDDSHPPAVLEQNLAQAEAVLREIAEEVLARHERSNLVAHKRLWEMVKQELCADVMALPKAEADANHKGEQYVPLMLEAVYGYGGNAPLVIASEEQSVKLGGRIDRLDKVLEAENNAIGFAVFDYKTGSSLPGGPAMFRGEDLQLPIYIMAGGMLLADEALGCALASYYQIRNGRARRAIQIKPGSEGLNRDTLLSAARGHVLDFVAAIRSGRFPVAPGGAQSCRYCDFRTACRYVQWRCRDKLREAPNA